MHEYMALSFTRLIESYAHFNWSCGSFCAVNTGIVSADFWLWCINLVMKLSRTNKTERNLL